MKKTFFGTILDKTKPPGVIVKQIFFFLLFVTLFPAFGQDGEDIPGEPQAPAESLEQPLPYILRSAQVNIEGWTQKNLLLYNLKIAPGQAFPSKEDFTLM